MKSVVRTGGLRSSERFPRAGPLWAWVGAAILLGLNVARASFHVWTVAELYSSADGSVQFVKLTNNSIFSTEYFLANHVITCTGPPGISNTFTFPTNLPAVSTVTVIKLFLLGRATWPPCQEA
jgi:hypothetical protein